MSRPFKGVIDLDIRKSKPDGDALMQQKAPKDAPNVLVILYDETGQAAWLPIYLEPKLAAAMARD